LKWSGYAKPATKVLSSRQQQRKTKRDGRNVAFVVPFVEETDLRAGKPKVMPTTFVVIDGNYLVYRIWNTASGQALRTKRGDATGIIHGFLSSFCAVVKKFKPEKIVVVWDHKSRYRRRVLKAYRAKIEELARKDPDSSAARIFDDLPMQYKESRYKNRSDEEHRNFQEKILPQMEALQQILPAMGIMQLTIHEVEGDDLIGIAVDTLSALGHVIVVSSDQDLYQLLSPTVSQYDPVKKKLFTASDFVEKYGIEPAQWAEVKALMGDVHDDIPGVPGIGAKIAAKLIAQYGNIVNLLDEANNNPKTAIMSQIPEYAEQIRMAYELSYILSSVDQLDEDQRTVFLKQWNIQPQVDWDEIHRFLDAYELKKVGTGLRDILTDTSSFEKKLLSAESLDDMFSVWGDCTRCPLHEKRNTIVKYSGPAKAKIMALGEAPGPSEDFFGSPFCGRAGKYLNETLLAHAGLDRNQIHVTNVVLCFPNSNGEIRAPTPEEISACNIRLRAHIRLVNPKLVILLGDKAFKAVFPHVTEKISTARGAILTHPDWPGITFIPVFHPSYLMRLQQGPNGHSDVVKSLHDWKLIRELADTL